MQTPRLMLTAMSSGSGKTTMTCALLRALVRRGLRPCAFKCGPDYIDPMFHREVLSVDSDNLDLFFLAEEGVRARLCRRAADADFAVIEGVMGYYDGLGGSTDRASAWHVASVTGTPAVLVVQPGGSSLTLAAQVRGLMQFRPDSLLRGVLLNACSPMQAQSLSRVLEQECSLPVLGFLPRMEEAKLESRHLGLVTAGEVKNLLQRIDCVAQRMEETVDLEALMRLGAQAKELTGAQPMAGGQPIAGNKPVIAVARDEAFCFYYAENLRLLEAMGAQLVFFSPLHDVCPPQEANALYLGGGYPELYAKQLSANRSMLEGLRRLVTAGTPTLAECGGYLVLCESLEDAEGHAWPMAGALPGKAVRTPRLQRFGYVEVTASASNLLLDAGQSLRAHSFHYWDVDELGQGCTFSKPVGGRTWTEGQTTPTCFASFAHIDFGQDVELAARFVRAAARKGERNVSQH